MDDTQISENKFVVKNSCKLTEHLIFISITINLPKITFSVSEIILTKNDFKRQN